MGDTKKIVCPVCGSRSIDEFGTNPGDKHWWLCRECGHNWDERSITCDYRLKSNDISKDIL